jgi:hypothetical protein
MTNDSVFHKGFFIRVILEYNPFEFDQVENPFGCLTFLQKFCKFKICVNFFCR